MSIINEIQNRRSIRKYKDTDVKDEDILQILEAARMAPSGSNTQPWKFIIVRDDKTKRAITEIDHNQKWMLTAPVFIVCMADISCNSDNYQSIYSDENATEYVLKKGIRDSSIAIGYMLLEAEHIGLGACWTGWYDQKDAKKVLDLPDYMYVTGVVTVGYADEEPKARPIKPMDEILWKRI